MSIQTPVQNKKIKLIKSNKIKFKKTSVLMTHSIDMTLQGVNGCACVDIPHSHCAVLATRHNSGTIGRE
jgi:hypothetical protein